MKAVSSSPCHGHQLAKKLYAGRKSVGHPSKAICCFDGPPITSATGSSRSRLRDSFLCTAVSKCAQPFGSAHGRFEVHMAICFLTSFTAIDLPHARCQLSIPHTPVINSTRPLSIPLPFLLLLHPPDSVMEPGSLLCFLGESLFQAKSLVFS